mgnify:CR=1 FL=1
MHRSAVRHAVEADDLVRPEPQHRAVHGVRPGERLAHVRGEQVVERLLVPQRALDELVREMAVARFQPAAPQDRVQDVAGQGSAVDAAEGLESGEARHRGSIARTPCRVAVNAGWGARRPPGSDPRPGNTHGHGVVQWSARIARKRFPGAPSSSVPIPRPAYGPPAANVMDLRDPQQLRKVYEANSRGLYNLAYRLVGDRQWAEDILQETFVRAYTRADTFKAGGKVSTWLYRLTMHLAYDHLRARRYRAMASLDAPVSDAGEAEATTWSATLASSFPEAAEEVERKDTEDCVKHLIDELPERERTVVLLRQYHGMTFKEIAAVLGLTSRTVQNCLRRAKQKLYFGLKEAGLAPADAAPLAQD